jgi:predicted MFS family arabinose efflux permease
MLAMVSLGFGEITGAIGMGALVDRIGQKYSCLINIALILIQTGVVLTYIFLDEYNWMAFAMTFVWGV